MAEELEAVKFSKERTYMSKEGAGFPYNMSVMQIGCLKRIANTMELILAKWENYELEQAKNTKIIKNLKARNKSLRNQLKGK